MRVNKYIAAASSLSRRAADAAIAAGRVRVNDAPVTAGQDVGETDVVTLDGRILQPTVTMTTIMFNKPTGYVCSRDGQGSLTIYDLLPPEYHHLNPVGRLDKDSSGLLLLTNDGQLAEQLTHPRYAKTKHYEITLDRPLQPLHQQIISDRGVMLDDGNSQFLVTKIDVSPGSPQRQKNSGELKSALKPSERGETQRYDIAPPPYRLPPTNYFYEITMQEGRNRQIRRTFASLGYTVTSLHRTHFGPYALDSLALGQWKLAE